MARGRHLFSLMGMSNTGNGLTRMLFKLRQVVGVEVQMITAIAICDGWEKLPGVMSRIPAPIPTSIASIEDVDKFCSGQHTEKL